MLVIRIPKSLVDEFLSEALPLLDTAAADYAQQCADILVAEYGAKREDIHIDIFRETAISDLVNGRPLDDPHLRVREAVRMYKNGVLGLG